MSLAGLYIGTSILISDLVFHLGFSHSKSLNPSTLISMNESKKKIASEHFIYKWCLCSQLKQLVPPLTMDSNIATK